ncbi:MAG TPA: hypothetical protein VGL86_13200, partial [Polyangia bacterium]
MCGEEAEFGRAAVAAAHGRRPMLVVARDLSGHEYETPPGHNLGGYALPGLLAAPAMALTGFDTIAQRTRAAVALRLAFLALYALALAAALAAIPCERRAIGGLLLALFSLFPLPLLSSVQVQYDGAVSTLLLAVAIAAIVRGGDDGRLLPWLLAAGGFAVSLGKLEYVGVALAAMLALAVWRRRPLAPVPFVAGVLAGSALSWLLDRGNLVGGYDVMLRFSGIQEHVPLWTRVRAYLPAQAALLWPLYVGLPAGVVGFAVTRERGRMLAPLVAALAVFVGYVAIAWRGDGFPRYFAPAFVLLPVALAQATRWPRIVGALALVAILPFGAHAWWSELHQRQFALCRRTSSAFDARRWSTEEEASPPRCVPVIGMQSGPSFYSRRAPFACCGAQWTSEWPPLAAQLCR